MADSRQGHGQVEGLSKKGKREKTHGHGQQYGDCWGSEMGEVEESMGG